VPRLRHMTTPSVAGRVYEFGLPDRLRVSRMTSGLGQREFEEVTGLSRATISNYERGLTKPRRPQLIAWAMATGFSLAWLETGKVLSPTNGGNLITDEYEQIPGGNVIDFPRTAWQRSHSVAILQRAA
jgi:transcriptional regulator with XRE-family HTH domain